MKTIIKKTALASIVAVLGAYMFVLPALAATTASLSPVVVKTSSGQTFNVVITVNPQGTSNYVEKLEINYPADTLEVTSFTFPSNWMALTQSGYDLVDNTKGILIKTAGYPTGITSATTFGTISFRAKKAGSGVIKIGSSSLSFEANSQNAITGSGTTVTITAPITAPPAEAPVVTPQKTVVPPVVSPVTSTETTVQTDSTSQAAAVTTAVPQKGGGNTLAWIFGVIALLALGYGVYATLRLRKQKEM